MKVLKKLRLINWHRFQNETIDFSESVLLSGENGAGKSTIIDAIQYVITCSRANFNKAAHDKGERTLNSYIRCKTGREDKPYERTGELSAHIALEFYDESKRQAFVIGIVMDSYSEEKEPNVFWYLMEKTMLADELFLSGRKVRSISEFRSLNKGSIRQYANTIRDAKNMITARFGRLDDKFFKLIPKAIAFRPIDDIKDFVYSYVLDEKEVNIDVLRENVRSYQDMERLLKDVKIRIEKLEHIIECQDELKRFRKLSDSQEYYINRAQSDVLEQEIADTKTDISRLENAVSQLEHEKTGTLQKRNDKEEYIRSIQSEIDNDEDYKALKELQRQEEELRIKYDEIRKSVSELELTVKESVKKMKQIVELGGLGEIGPGYIEMFGNIDRQEDIEELKELQGRMILEKTKLNNKTQQHIAELKNQLQIKKNDLSDINEKIAALEKKQLTYPDPVRTLKNKILEQLQSTGRSADVRILCEMLEIKENEWRNAVEGYLNNQRFYLLVDPDDYDLAVSVYDRLRAEKKVYGVGLINTGKLDAYDSIPEGSLAESVDTRNIYARRYVNMILGRVQKCNSYQELKKYPVSITRQCMRYQNNVVSAIPPKVFNTPYIGAEAYVRQLKQAEEKRKEIEADISLLKDDAEKENLLAGFLDTEIDNSIKYRLNDMIDKRRTEYSLAECRKKIKALPKNETIIQKTLRIQEEEKEKKKLDDQLGELFSTIGAKLDRRSVLEERITASETELNNQIIIIDQIKTRLGSIAEECESEYLKLRLEKTADTIKINYERSRKGILTSIEKSCEKMVDFMNRYKSEHDFGASASEAGFSAFFNEYDKLKNSQLLEYEEKVYIAKKAAEEEFREQFLSRLQENIKQAQQEFKELNKALDGIHFSNEQYEFRYAANKKYKNYYDMIMDDFNIMQGESIFSGSFNESHREVIEELFERLVIDDDNSAKTLKIFTDYRTYMDYDIRIINDNGSYMYYSKVSKEKSGGETQTPFYITVAASFMQMYRNSIGDDSVGIIMMDEAFNNMDDERMQGVLSFLTGAESHLQLIISCPPERIQYIAPSVNKVLLVLRDGRNSYVEDFVNEKI